MNLAHGDVKVLVLLVAVADCDVLVLLKARCFDGTTHNDLEFPFAQGTVVRMKRDHQMVGLVTLGAGIPSLVGLDDLNRGLRIFTSVQAFEISGHEPRAALGSLSPQHVLNEPPEPWAGQSLALGGDIILSIHGIRIGETDYQKRIQERGKALGEDEQVEVTVLRNGDVVNLSQSVQVLENN